MPPETNTTPDTPQPVPESPSPIVEDSVPATEPATPPQEVLPTSTPETAPSESVVEVSSPVEVQTDQSPSPTAQIPPNEPIVPESDPIEPASEPPSAAASAPVPVISVVAPQTGILHTVRDLLIKARVSIQDRKRKKRDKIMLALNTKNKITNDEVEKLLHVSDATAERYLATLVKEGKIKQVGKTGAGVAYTKI